MKECKYCRTKYNDNLAICPNCGGTKVVTAEELAEEAEIKRREVEYRERANAAPEMHKKHLIGILAAVLSVIVAAIVLIAVNANKPLSNGMTKAEGEEALAAGIACLDNGEYESAMEYFLQLLPDSKQYSEAQSLLLQSQNSYRSEILNRVNSHLTSKEYDTAFGLISKAQELLPNDPELSSVYDTAYTAYRSSVLEQVDSYVLDDQYELALEYLNGIQSKFPNDAVLQDSYSTTRSAYYAEVRSEAIGQADNYVADNDYANAIKTINTALNKIGEDEELSARLTIYTNTFKDNIMQQIDSVYAESGYDAVITLLKNAISVLPEDSSLKQEYSLWISRSPVSLTDLEYYSKSGTIQTNFSLDCKDNFGTSYPSCISPYDSGTPYIEYFLGGEYAKFSGVLYVTSHAKSINSSHYNWGIATVSIYGDDALLYTHTGFSPKDNPLEITVDISGVDFLKISFKDAYYVDTGLDESLIGLGNPTLGW